VDVAHKWSAEAVDEELDRLIAKRASQDRRPDPDAEHERWKASVRAYNRRRQEEMRAAWCEYHQDQAARHRAVLEQLVASHEEQAERYREQPKGE
jgi:type II secretory ATPase GspE/PulE/Tfp pilus assembly ATPase PilB-like protein